LFQFFFLVSVSFLFSLSQASYLSHNRLFLDFLLFQFHLKHFVFLSLSATGRLNWQLACQFSSANHPSYRIVQYADLGMLHDCTNSL